MSVNHYENFPVASMLCPARLRPAVRAIYAYARTADDLADEGDATAGERLSALHAYRADLHKALAGEPTSGRWNDVFEPLPAQVREHGLPVNALDDLLSAFCQDVGQPVYADRTELLDYCSRSANPVGRLMLALYGVRNARVERQADQVCTALQLINFWQDVGRDASRGRLYVPQADAHRHGFDARDLLAVNTTLDAKGPRGLPAALADLCSWARSLMLQGADVVHAVPGRAGWELRGVVQGGLRVLDHLHRRGYDSFVHRPTLGMADVPVLMWRAMLMSPAPQAAVTAA